MTSLMMAVQLQEWEAAIDLLRAATPEQVQYQLPPGHRLEASTVLHLMAARSSGSQGSVPVWTLAAEMFDKAGSRAMGGCT